MNDNKKIIIPKEKNNLPNVPQESGSKKRSVSVDVHQGGRLTVSEQRGKLFAQRRIDRVKTGFDRPLLVIILILLLFGTVMVFSASYAWAENDYGDRKSVV